MESEVRPLLARMEQAAYDVLFNKETWHDFSQARRESLMFSSATTDPDSLDLQITKGKDAAFTFEVLDSFGAYPLDLGAMLTAPQSDWWCDKGEPAESTA